MKKISKKESDKLVQIRILTFIKTIRNSFEGAQSVYTQGSCYQFFRILQTVFPDAEAYYDLSHVITKINNRFYDITGEVPLETHKSIERYWTLSKVKECKFSIYGHGYQCSECGHIGELYPLPELVFKIEN